MFRSTLHRSPAEFRAWGLSLASSESIHPLSIPSTRVYIYLGGYRYSGTYEHRLEAAKTLSLQASVPTNVTNPDTAHTFGHSNLDYGPRDTPEVGRAQFGGGGYGGSWYPRVEAGILGSEYFVTDRPEEMRSRVMKPGFRHRCYFNEPCTTQANLNLTD